LKRKEERDISAEEATYRVAPIDRRMMLAIQTRTMIGFQRCVSSLLAEMLYSTADGTHLGLTIPLRVALDLPVGIVLLRVVNRDSIGEFSRFSGVRGKVGRFGRDERRVKAKQFDRKGVIRCGCAEGLESNGGFSLIDVGEVGLRGRMLFIVKTKNRTSSETKEAGKARMGRTYREGHNGKSREPDRNNNSYVAHTE
jgi:hypothetical protein